VFLQEDRRYGPKWHVCNQYDQWKVNKFCLLSGEIIGNKIVPADLQDATLCVASVFMLAGHTAEWTALER